MNENNSKSHIELTPAERIILASYQSFAEGLANYLGEDYEIILHSLEDCSHSAIKILNGHYTGRAEDTPISDVALSMLNRSNNLGQNSRDITYFYTNKRGEPLKSSTIAILGEDQRIIGVMCINFYMSTPFYNFINNFTNPVERELHVEHNSQPDDFANNIDYSISQSVERIRERVLGDNEISASNKNKEIINQLYDIGIFNFKDSVVKVAEILNINKNTVYMHIRNHV